MTAVTAPDTSPAETSQIWRHREILQCDAPGHEVGNALRESADCLAWIFLPRQESAALKTVAEHLELDALAVEDVLSADEGCKLEWIGQSMICVTGHAGYNSTESELVLHPVSLIAGRRSLVIMVDDDLRPVLAKALDHAKAEVLEDGIPGALHAVLDTIVDSYTSVLDRLEQDTEALADKLFDDRPLLKAEQLQAFRLRRALAKLRRVTQPMRDITTSLANAAHRDSGAGEATDPAEILLGTRSAREFSDVADHAGHAASGADALREEIVSMYETNLALADVHLNTVMKKLSGWAAIIAVPTLITGFMGMNVPYPGFASTTGFVVAFAVMLIAVTALYVMFKRKDWL